MIEVLLMLSHDEKGADVSGRIIGIYGSAVMICAFMLERDVARLKFVAILE